MTRLLTLIQPHNLTSVVRSLLDLQTTIVDSYTAGLLVRLLVIRQLSD